MDCKEAKQKATEEIEKMRAALAADQRTIYAISRSSGVAEQVIKRFKDGTTVNLSFVVAKQLAAEFGYELKLRLGQFDHKS